MGTFYHGSQYQPSVSTIQGELYKAFKQLNWHHLILKVVFSGRTDKGVHALGQVINFLLNLKVSPNKLQLALNNFLPRDIRIIHTEIVHSSFNARLDAKDREYKYLVSNSANLPLYYRSFITIVDFNLNTETINSFIRTFIGTHDFINFRNLGSDEKSTIRTIQSFKLVKKNIPCIYSDISHEVFEFSIIANSFLYNMVRNIIGAIFMMIKKNNYAIINELLCSIPVKQRIYKAVPAIGLTLVKVNY